MDKVIAIKPRMLIPRVIRMVFRMNLHSAYNEGVSFNFGNTASIAEATTREKKNTKISATNKQLAKVIGHLSFVSSVLRCFHFIRLHSAL